MKTTVIVMGTLSLLAVSALGLAGCGGSSSDTGDSNSALDRTGDPGANQPGAGGDGDKGGEQPSGDHQEEPKAGGNDTAPGTGTGDHHEPTRDNDAGSVTPPEHHEDGGVEQHDAGGRK